MKYIDETDLASEKVRIRSAEERARDSVNNVDPDAEDMGVLRSRPAGLGLADEWQPLRRMVSRHIAY